MSLTKYQNVINLANSFLTLAEDQGSNYNDWESQQSKLDQFYLHFSKSLRFIINSLEGSLWSLKERKFDTKGYQALVKLQNQLIEINKQIKPNNPYLAANKLVNLVLDRPNLMIIDTLDFLIKHHLQQTQVDFRPSLSLRHPDVKELTNLKDLAEQLRNFMSKNPLIEKPTISTQQLENTLQDVPSFKGGPEDKTKV